MLQILAGEEHCSYGREKETLTGHREAVKTNTPALCGESIVRLAKLPLEGG